MKITALAVTSLLVFSVACSDDEPAASPDAGVDSNESTLSYSFTNLPNLGADYVYEGWLITSDGPVSSGRFTVDDSGALSPATFTVDKAMAAAAAKFVLTIEPATGDVPAPADSHILAGPISGGSAALSVADDAALGTDFASAAGSYILATPSTAANMADNNQGIWWLVPGDTPAASLTLPTLPAGWVYEGWVVGAGGPVSTGTFTAIDAADGDGAGSTAGTDGAPAFPGQDFINPAMDLVGGAAVISVEPMPDNSAMPFIIKPLVDGDVEDIAAPSSQAMANTIGNSTATIPSGTASFEDAE